MMQTYKDHEGLKKSQKIEAFGDGFSLSKLLQVRSQTLELLQKIADCIKPGMVEEDAYELAKVMIRESGFEKNWHRPYVRFGANTIKVFGEPSIPGSILGENDIFFIDLGPVRDGYEGDAGLTRSIGASGEMSRCASDVKDIFMEVANHWRKNSVTGAGLYRFAEQSADRRGWKLITDTSGHRLSEFPHQTHFSGSLLEIESVPIPNAWVLEIQIRHPEHSYGAFFEDLLLLDE